MHEIVPRWAAPISHGIKCVAIDRIRIHVPNAHIIAIRSLGLAEKIARPHKEGEEEILIDFRPATAHSNEQQTDSNSSGSGGSQAS